MNKATCLLLIALLLNSTVSAQCEETVLGPHDAYNQAWESAAICGDQAVYARGGFARGFSSDVWSIAYVYCYWDGGTAGDESDDRWMLQDTLYDPNGPDTPGWNEEDLFGDESAIEDDLLLISASGYLESGSIFSYAKDDQGTQDELDDKWILREELAPRGPVGNLGMGNSLSLKDGLLAIGSRGGTTPSDIQSGAVTIFQRERHGTTTPLDDTWETLFEVYPPHPQDRAHFGTSVSIDGDLLLVGSNSNQPYVYRRVTEAGVSGQVKDRWEFEAELVPDSPSEESHYWQSVAIDGEWAVFGAYYDEDFGPEAGAAYVFKRTSQGTWNQWEKLIPRMSLPNDKVGLSVSIEGSTIVLGAPGVLERGGEDFLGTPWFSGPAFKNAGAAYVYQLDEGSERWVEKFKLSPNNSGNFNLGANVILDPERIVVTGERLAGEGRTWIYRRDQDFCASPGAISLAAGGTQELNFNAGQEQGEKAYLILGSMTGTTPGMPLPGGLTLPLVPDAYYQLTKQAGSGPLVDFTRKLRGWGAARASLTIPPLSEPALAGLTLYHAAVVGDDLSQATLVSNPVSLQLRP